MKEKLEDLKLRFKHDRRIWAAAGLCVFVFLVWSFTSNEPRRQRKSGQQVATASKISVSDSEGFSDLLRAFRSEIDDVINVSRTHSESLERMEKERAASEDRTRGALQSIVERIESMDEKIQELKTMPPPEAVSGGPTTSPLDSTAVEPATAQPFGFEKDTVPPPPTPPETRRISVITAGDSVPLELLTGVAAPTDGTPYPTVFRVLGPVVGPDGSSLDVGEARLIAAAQGSETDARVVYRLTTLALRHKDGRRSEVKVDGWVVGEDGIRGMKGQVIDKLGEVIAATAGVSFAAALGDRVNDRGNDIPLNDITFDRRGRIVRNNQGVNVTGSDVDVATASALTDASNRLGQLLLEKYQKLIPVVEVRSGRKVAAVFSTTSEIEILESEDDEGIYAAHSLD